MIEAVRARTPTATRLRLGAALILGASSGAIMLCTVVPPPIMLLIPPSIAGAELAPWMLFIGLAVLALVAWPAGRWRWLRRSALGLGLLVVVLALRVLVQVPAAIRTGEAVMVAAFGPAYGATRGAGTPPTLSAVVMLRGHALPPLRIHRAVPMLSVAGQVLHADIYQPLTPGPHAVVIAIHGGSWRSGTRSEGATCHHALAASGLVVVAIDYRFAPAFTFPAQRDDVQSALDWVRTHAADYAGDPARIALLGRSAGAQLALLAAYRKDSGIRSAVGFYSPVDFTIGYRQPTRPDPLDARAVFRDYLGGTPDDLPERYREASPITHATTRRPPTLLIYGGRDHLVELRFGAALAAALRTQGTPVALLDIPWAEHAFDLLPHGLGGQLALHHLVRFLHLTLAVEPLSAVPRAPVGAAQQ